MTPGPDDVSGRDYPGNGKGHAQICRGWADAGRVAFEGGAKVSGISEQMERTRHRTVMKPKGTIKENSVTEITKEIETPKNR